ncbi:hypothetical protein PR048_027150 [Dryococelus australis]|uniref:Uncharacterized protein n=1 Tax=Dryococelus australis TaxID=614101 RepID=A0ABQ9GEM8_9NEOP|nr:hypothetical protein PR048_027150 [Dryococelus australis]
MKQRRNARKRETGEPRGNTPTSRIFQHDSHVQKSWVIPSGIEPSSPWREESHLTTTPATIPTRGHGGVTERILQSRCCANDTAPHIQWGWQCQRRTLSGLRGRKGSASVRDVIHTTTDRRLRPEELLLADPRTNYVLSAHVRGLQMAGYEICADAAESRTQNKWPRINERHKSLGRRCRFLAGITKDSLELAASMKAADLQKKNSSQLNSVSGQRHVGTGPRWYSGQTTRFPPRLTGFDSWRGRSRIFACGDRAGRRRWLVGFLGDLPFLPPLHSGAASYSPRFKLIGYQDWNAVRQSSPGTFYSAAAGQADREHYAARISQ